MVFKIADIVHSDPPLYMVTYNATTGEVLTKDADYANGFIFTDATVRDNAITLINSCSSNAGKFTGHVPPPPHNH